MAKQKKKRNWRFGGEKSMLQKRSRSKSAGRNFFQLLKIAGVFFVAALVVGLMVFLQGYVRKSVGFGQKRGDLKLLDVPVWVNETLKEKIYKAACSDGEDFCLDDDAAWSVQQNIRTVAWVDDVVVRTGNDSLVVSARWRRPVAMIMGHGEKFYVDRELVVLDYVEVTGLPIVQVTGVILGGKIKPGETLGADDLAAAVTILNKLLLMDDRISADKPLLNEIGRIDMSNFNGRKNDRFAHVIMYTHNNTEILWGAEFGNWQRYLESPDEEKLAKLYGHYKKYGTLGNNVKYINLRDPQDRIPEPIDKY